MDTVDESFGNLVNLLCQFSVPNPVKLSIIFIILNEKITVFSIKFNFMTINFFNRFRFGDSLTWIYARKELIPI